MTQHVVELWKCVFDIIQNHLTIRTEASNGKACHIADIVRLQIQLICQFNCYIQHNISNIYEWLADGHIKFKS